MNSLAVDRYKYFISVFVCNANASYFIFIFVTVIS